MKRLCLLCGLPGSGKTTVIENMKQIVSKEEVAFVVFDEILEELAGQEFTAEAWHAAQRAMRLIVSGLLKECDVNEIPEAFQKIFTRIWPSPEIFPSVVFVEDNFYYKSMRATFRRIAIETNSAYLCWYLKCSADVCTERYESRKERYQMRVPKETINKMLELAVWDGAVAINSEELSAVEICEKMRQEYSDPSLLPAVDLQKQSEEKLKVSQQECLTNANHQLDIALRKATSVFLSAVPSSSRGLLSKHITSSKKAALSSARDLVTMENIDEVADAYAVSLWKMYAEVNLA
eukprot:TRINITY_DN16024_c0_g1_i1.p1 TRINITY_DN16024_c0_g1~~TRINITY_DN16024_c0_g1_i1.p1  ORF type:complete len:292 (+),score=44.94 TRINITY_DN16024_c0_g1_i1:80-955(+)